MNIEEIKSNWTALEDSLSKKEILDDQTIKGLLSRNIDSSFLQLKKRHKKGLVLGIIMLFVIIIWFVIEIIQHWYSFFIIEMMPIVGIINHVVCLRILNTTNMQSEVAEMQLRFNKYQKCYTLLHSPITYIFAVIWLVIFFASEGRFVNHSGALWPMFSITVFITIVIAVKSLLKINTQFRTINEQLEELREFGQNNE